jgi:hypothetical protein
MQTLVMNIKLKREFFAAILSVPPRKTVEYRDLSDYWMSRLDNVGAAPFNLRLMNGMNPPVPEATVRVDKVVFDEENGQTQFHLGTVLEVKNWDQKKERPC